MQINQGEPTRALDFRRTAGLDLLTRLLFDSAGKIPGWFTSALSFEAEAESKWLNGRAVYPEGPDGQDKTAKPQKAKTKTFHIHEVRAMDNINWPGSWSSTT